MDDDERAEAAAVSTALVESAGEEAQPDDFAVGAGSPRPLKSVNVTWARSHLAVLKRVLPLAGLKVVESPCAGAASVAGSIIWVVTQDDVAQRLAALKPRQWLSRVPEISQVCTKQGLAEALAAAGVEQDWVPKTWLLPHDQEQVLEYCDRHPQRTLIYKPSGAGMGDAVFLMLGRADVDRKVGMMKGAPAVVQRYIERPFLVDGRKCDLRLFLLVVVPKVGLDWRVFLFREGLVRICSETYGIPTRATLHKSAVHLTNSCISSLQPGAQELRCTESLAQLAARLGDEAWDATWQAIRAMLESAMVACHAAVQRSTSRCFHIVGADVLLDEALRPHLLELNDLASLKLGRTVLLNDPIVQELGLKKCTAPCFDHRVHAHAPSELDDVVKVPLVAAALRLVQRAASSGGSELPSTGLAAGLPFEALEL